MSYFTPEIVRKKKRFTGDLRSFIKRHGLSYIDAAKIIEADNSSIGQWLSGKATPQVKSTIEFRERMKAYDEAHPKKEPEQIQADFSEPEVRNEQGIGLKMSGPNFSFECVVTMQQAASIISLVAQQ